MSSEQIAVIETERRRGRSRRTNWLLIIGIVIVANIAAFILVPPVDPGNPDGACSYPVCFINGTLELPAPHVVWPADHHGDAALITVDVSITNTLLTLWIITAILIVVFIAVTRRLDSIPGRAQNAVEWGYESLENFGTSLG